MKPTSAQGVIIEDKKSRFTQCHRILEHAKESIQEKHLLVYESLHQIRLLDSARVAIISIILKACVYIKGGVE